MHGAYSFSSGLRTQISGNWNPASRQIWTFAGLNCLLKWPRVFFDASSTVITTTLTNQKPEIVDYHARPRENDDGCSLADLRTGLNKLTLFKAHQGIHLCLGYSDKI